MIEIKCYFRGVASTNGWRDIGGGIMASRARRLVSSKSPVSGGFRADLPPPQAWGVAALLQAVSDALQSRLGAITVRGELSGFTRAASGHCYFNLKDSDGQTAMLRCAMFRRAASLLEFRPADGHQVELRGRIAVYEQRGELQCVVESMQPLGAGSLFELFMRLKARLEAEGLFAEDRKRPIPAHPRAVGVVSSLQAAALHDVLTAVARRAPHVAVVVYPSAVQGVDAPAQLVQAIAQANERDEVDALIVCRGGGSLEDLWAFNDERVVRAVAASRLPVVCGVGHETDFTLSDLAADLRAPTPTAAAELSTPVTTDELARLQAAHVRAVRALTRELDRRAQRLDLLSLQFGRPGQWVSLRQSRLQALAQQAGRAAMRRLSQEASQLARGQHRHDVAGLSARRQRAATLDGLAARLAAVDPRQVLSRGYAWLSDAGGRPVCGVAGLVAGQQLSAQWFDGRADVEVERITASRPLE